MKRIALALAIVTCTVASTEAMAQADLGLKRVGAAVGFVSPENLDGVLTFGVFADMGTLTPKISLEPRLDFWSWSEDAFGSETTVRDVTLGVRGKYGFQVANSSIRPFAGAGLGMHFLHAKVTIPAQGGNPEMTAEDSETKLGVDLGGGFSTQMNPVLDFHAEVWYGIVSDFDQLSLRAGISRKIGP